MTPFAQGSEHHALDAAAEAIAHAAVAAGEIAVVIVRPGRADHRVYGEGANGVVRAAVSVAEAAGNTRVWADAPIGYTIARPVASLPAVVSQAAESSGLRTVYVGVAASDGQPAAVALWFAVGADDDPAAEERRRETLQVLSGAGHRDDRQAEERAAGERAARERAAEDRAAQPAVVDGSDALDGFVDDAGFGEVLEECEAEQATVVVIRLDRPDGATTPDGIVREVAARLRATCRSDDVLARLGNGRFALLLAGVDRSAALAISKRLVAAIAEPLDPALGSTSITASVGLAHQAGMPDTAELFESATAASESGHRAGGDRLMVAS